MIIENEIHIGLLANRVEAFTSMGSKKGVGRLALTESRDVNVAIWGFAALIPTFPIKTSNNLYVFSVIPALNIKTVIPRMKTVELPPDVLAMGIKEDPEDKAFMDSLAAKYFLPRAVLGIGNFLDTGREHIALWFPRGNDPQKILDEIQAGLKDTADMNYSRNESLN